MKYECPVFYPTLADVSGTFEAYIERLEKKMGASGICKIVAPDGWNPRRCGYPDTLDLTIERPIRQHATGSRGLFRAIHIEQKPMSLRDDFRPLALDPDNNCGTTTDPHELERKYWKNVTLRPPLYGADVAGSLFDNKPAFNGWNLRRLNTLLSRVLQQEGHSLPGVNTPYLYFGTWRSSFAWHTEDLDLYSVNYLHFGAPKSWYVVPPEHRTRLESVIKGMLPEMFRPPHGCPEFLRHKELLISPQLLEQYQIPYVKVVQHPREFIINCPGAYHAGFNHGYNCAESVNFGTRKWIPLGAAAGHCTCSPDSVKINMKLFRDLVPAKLLPPELFEDSSDDDSDSCSKENGSDEDSDEEEQDDEEEEEEAEQIADLGRKRQRTKQAGTPAGSSGRGVSRRMATAASQNGGRGAARSGNGKGSKSSAATCSGVGRRLAVPVNSRSATVMTSAKIKHAGGTLPVQASKARPPIGLTRVRGGVRAKVVGAAVRRRGVVRTPNGAAAARLRMLRKTPTAAGSKAATAATAPPLSTRMSSGPAGASAKAVGRKRAAATSLATQQPRKVARLGDVRHTVRGAASRGLFAAGRSGPAGLTCRVRATAERRAARTTDVAGGRTGRQRDSAEGTQGRRAPATAERRAAAAAKRSRSAPAVGTAAAVAAPSAGVGQSGAGAASASGVPSARIVGDCTDTLSPTISRPPCGEPQCSTAWLTLRSGLKLVPVVPPRAAAGAPPARGASKASIPVAAAQLVPQASAPPAEAAPPVDASRPRIARRDAEAVEAQAAAGEPVDAAPVEVDAPAVNMSSVEADAPAMRMSAVGAEAAAASVPLVAAAAAATSSGSLQSAPQDDQQLVPQDDQQLVAPQPTAACPGANAAIAEGASGSVAEPAAVRVSSEYCGGEGAPAPSAEHTLSAGGSEEVVSTHAAATAAAANCVSEHGAGSAGGVPLSGVTPDVPLAGVHSPGGDGAPAPLTRYEEALAAVMGCDTAAVPSMAEQMGSSRSRRVKVLTPKAAALEAERLERMAKPRSMVMSLRPARLRGAV